MNKPIPKTNLLAHRAIGGGFAGLSLFLLLADAPLITLLGLGGVIAGSAYTLASFTLAGFVRATEDRLSKAVQTAEHDAERHRSRYAREMESLKSGRSQVQERLAGINTQLAQMQRDAATIKQRLQTEHDAELKQARQALADEFRSKGLQLEADAALKLKQADDERLKRWKSHRSKLVGDNRQLHERIEALEEKLKQRDEYLRREFNQQLATYRQSYQELGEAMAQQGAVVGEAKAEFLGRYESLKEERDRLVEQVKRLSAPKRFRRHTDRDVLGNKILSYFNQRDLKLEGEDWSERFGVVDYWLYPLGDTKVSDIKRHTEDLQARLGFLSVPKIETDSGCIKLSVQVASTGTQGSPTDTQAVSAMQFPEPPLSRLEQAISKAIHLRIVAPTGAGKSVLLGNVVNYLSQSYLSEYELFDPKVTAREVWGNLEPTYYGAECLSPFFSLTKTCMKRIEQVIAARKADAPDPVFDPQFHIIDELEFLFGLSEISDVREFNSKLFKLNCKSVLKVGREHKIKLLFVTQSPLPSDLNLRKNDLHNTASIFLGKSILKALDSELLSDVDEAKRRLLKAQYKARLDAGKKWTFLFYDPQKPTDAWLGTCPEPGHYSSVDLPENQRQPRSPEPAPKCTEKHTGQSAQPSGQNGAGPAQPQSAQTLAQALAQGTYCPDCSHHSASFKSKKPTRSGHVRVYCKNSECSTDNFKWKPV